MLRVIIGFGVQNKHYFNVFKDETAVNFLKKGVSSI